MRAARFIVAVWPLIVMAGKSPFSTRRIRSATRASTGVSEGVASTAARQAPMPIASTIERARPSLMVRCSRWRSLLARLPRRWQLQAAAQDHHGEDESCETDADEESTEAAEPRAVVPVR